MNKRNINGGLKYGLLALSVGLIAVSIVEIINADSITPRIICALLIAVILMGDAYLLFCTKGMDMNKSNKKYRDLVYMNNKPKFIPSGEKFLEVAAIDDIVSKATSVINKTGVPEHELCPICGKEIVRERTTLYYTIHTSDKSENKYWGDEYGNYVRPAYEEHTHYKRNEDAVKIHCPACKFELTVGWGEKTEKDINGDLTQMPTRFAYIGGINLCQASKSKLKEELKIADKIQVLDRLMSKTEYEIANS